MLTPEKIEKIIYEKSSELVDKHLPLTWEDLVQAGYDARVQEENSVDLMKYPYPEREGIRKFLKGLEGNHDAN